DWVGGDDGILAIAMLAAVGALLLAYAHHSLVGRLCGTGLALLCALLQLANRDRALIDVTSHRTIMSGVQHQVVEDRELGRTWNALARLGFFPTADGANIYVRIDSSCQTLLPSQDPQQRARQVAATTFERLPFVLDRHRRCLEIGAGGGRGMVLAQAMGAE